jgi:hydrogenase expression/formation protein HypD
MYNSVVCDNGNKKALGFINKYFEISDEYWRGIGKINYSGLKLKEAYLDYDAGSNFIESTNNMPNGCRCSDVILGRINPIDCPLFKKSCTPLNAIGPCMVSTEGACGIWYNNIN